MNTILSVLFFAFFLGMLLFVLVLVSQFLFTNKTFGFIYMFDKKRRVIISNIIELIKNDSDNWRDIDCTLKRYKGISIVCGWSTSRPHIANNRNEIELSFIESVRLSRHFKKLTKYKNKKKYTEAIDKILLETSGMNEL